MAEREYDNAKHQQFVEDMEDVGFEVKHYRGRNFYDGPAVFTDDIQEAIRATDLRLQSDRMGKRGYVVYPA